MDEKTILYTYLPDISTIDYPEEKAAVFFTTGCNFRCGFCYNTSLLKRQEQLLTFSQLREQLKRFKQNWISGVVITGGEPLIHPEYWVIKTLEAIKAEHLKIKLDTNGSFPKKLEHCLPYLNYVAVDIKASPRNYQKITGVPYTNSITDTINLLRHHKIKHEFRTTILETVHKHSDMVEIAELIKGAPLYILQAFLPEKSIQDKNLLKLPRTSKKFLEKMADVVIPHVERVEIRGALNAEVNLW